LTQDLKHAYFYGILDRSYVSPSQWKSKCLALLQGGADIIQIRAKEQTHAQRLQLLEKIYPLIVTTNIPLIINDDLELALKYPRLGLHIGQQDIPPIQARKQLGPKRILGLSTHSLKQAKQAITLAHNTLSYFALGPIFSTPTKPNYTPVGLHLASQVETLAPPIPFFCIGGINRKNITQVKNLGVKRVAVVSDVLCDNNTTNAVKQIRQILKGYPD
jgi:thiamine-phosphate pyrophosphorylase